MRLSFKYVSLLLVGLCLIPSIAYASGGGPADNLKNVLYLLGVMSIAYIGAHVFAENLERRFGIVTGAEYILIGILVGPWSPILKALNFSVIDVALLKQLSPFLVLGTGAIGLLTGLRFEVWGRGKKPKLIKSIIISIITFIIVTVPIYAVSYGLFPDYAAAPLIPIILCAGAMALVADSASIQTLINFLDAKGAAGTYALSMARLCSSIAVIAFGSIFCMYHDPAKLLDQTATSVPFDYMATLQWLAVHIVIGVVLGAIFALFLIRKYEDDKILTVTIGLVIFTSGLAYYLRLSPIFTNFILGVFLRIVSKQSDQVEKMLVSVERPLYITLFFFGGALLSFDVSWWAYAAILVYVGLRLAGRATSGVIAFRFHPSRPTFLPMGGILLAPGGLSIAMLLNFHDIYEALPYASEAYVALLGGILISEITAYRYARRWLIDSTDVALVDPKGGSKDTQTVTPTPSQGGAA